MRQNNNDLTLSRPQSPLTNEFPEGVMKLAEEALDNLLCNCTESCGGYDGLRTASILDIARAIMADREDRAIEPERRVLVEKLRHLAERPHSHRFWEISELVKEAISGLLDKQEVRS